jgi:hypothetical protein
LVLPVTTVVATPEGLPSLSRRIRVGAQRSAASTNPVRCLIGWRYWLDLVGRVRRRGIFTGQCYQPLCPSETAKHPQEPSVIAARRRMEKTTSAKKQPSRTSTVFGVSSLMAGRNAIPLGLNFTWPLRRHSLLSNPGYVPRALFGSLPGSSLEITSSSEVFRTNADPPG